MNDEIVDLQSQLESSLGRPAQMLGGRSGSLTLRYDRTDLNLLSAFHAIQAKVLSSGMTPTRVGGPAIVPRIVARKGSVSLLARGRCERDELVGMDIVLTEPTGIAATNAPAVFAFLVETLEGMPDPEEAFVGLVNHVLDVKYAESPVEGRRLLGRLLAGIGHHLVDNADN